MHFLNLKGIFRFGWVLEKYKQHITFDRNKLINNFSAVYIFVLFPPPSNIKRKYFTRNWTKIKWMTWKLLWICKSSSQACVLNRFWHGMKWIDWTRRISLCSRKEKAKKRNQFSFPFFALIANWQIVFMKKSLSSHRIKQMQSNRSIF